MIIYYSLTGSGSSWRSSFLTPSCWVVGWRAGGRGGLTLMSGRDGRAEDVEGEAGEAGTLSVSLWKYIVISVWRFCVFISLKMFLCVISPPSTICFLFSAFIIGGSMPYKSEKQSWVLRTLLPDCLMSICSWHCFFYILFLIIQLWFGTIHLHPVVFC